MRLSYLEGLSLRAIAKKLKLSRRTVRLHLGKLPPRQKSERIPPDGLLTRFEPQLKTWLEETPELRAPQLLERLRKLGYAGGISILRDRLRLLRPRPVPRAFATLDFFPGEALQVDWADFGFALPGIPRRVSAFVAVLAYSRYLYIEFTVSQAMGSFLRCMDRALAFFGGATTIDIFDNMKTVVLEHPRSGPPRFNPRFLSYATARGNFAVVACTPRNPQSKGRVERPIGFVRERFWSGRHFSDLVNLNQQAQAWRDDFANRREHETTGKVPALVFEHEERPKLKPVRPGGFDTEDIDNGTVTKMHRVRFDRNSYSVPWMLTSQSVLVRANDALVQVFLGPKCVASHERSWDVGKDICAATHDQSHKDRGHMAQMDPAQSAVSRFGEVGKSYFINLAAGTRSMRREALKLVFLAELFGTREVQSAMQEVMQTGHIGVEYVEYILRHKRNLRPQSTPLHLGNPAFDSIVLQEPDLSLYDPPAPTRDPGDLPSEQEP
jgi:transposase